MIELILLLAIAAGILFARGYDGKDFNKYILKSAEKVYTRYAPYSFKVVREKTKELGQEFTPRQYAMQASFFGIFAGVVSFLYFYNIIISLVYVVIAIAFIPYLAYLRCKRVYSEYIFEQIQSYTTNTMMEFATTQSFVKSLEGVRDSGILQDPVKGDVNHMIQLSYQNGTIDEAIEYMNQLYPYYIVKNMHQLFLQITKEGSQNSIDSLDNMQMDIDSLVESVYRDRIERQQFHKQFLQFGIMLYVMAMLVQYLLGTESYLILLEKPIVKGLLHGIILINSFFLLRGEKYYNENVGAE